MAVNKYINNFLVSELFPSNSRELPVFPAVLGNMSISRLFANLEISPMKFCYNTRYSLPE